MTAGAQTSADAPRGEQAAAPAPGLAIVLQDTYPELRVDGAPFFVHSAAFFYYRIPRDLWESSLDRHRELGINTIDLYIPWNWHEPREGEFDFEGKTNPRRDLRGLLKLIAERGFKLIARPGPVILNEWRHGGYPEWLLERPEYGMPLLDRLEGRYPPLANLNARDAEAAARGWLENPTHLAFAKRWFERVAQELAPWSAFGKRIRIEVPSEKRNARVEKEVSGPLLFVQVDDGLGLARTNTAGPAFWQYARELCRMAAEAGIEAPCFINPSDFRIPAAGAALEKPIGVMGQWYLQPVPSPASNRPRGEEFAAAITEAQEPVEGPRQLTALDATSIEFLVETLKTQPAFPPIFIEYQAGWYAPGDDARPEENHPANTLLSSRLFFAHGLKGFSYFPIQDSLTPAGFETPWTNRHYRWDAALNAAGERQARAHAVKRNAQLMELWGEALASMRKRADFGVVYPLAAFPQERLGREDVHRVAQTTMQLMRLAHLAGLSVELLDPEHQPVEQFLRHAAVLLPVFDPSEEKFQLSERAQRALVDYVRRGGTLIWFPARPAGSIVQELWTAGQALEERAPKPASAVSAVWSFGQGQAVESTKEFLAWLELNESFAANRERMEADWAIGALREFLERAGLRPVLKRGKPDPNLVVTELASVTARSNVPMNREAPRSRGLLSVTNLNYKEAAEETIEILSPQARPDAVVASPPGVGAGYLPLRVTVPPRESLLLPLHFPLCSAARAHAVCSDEVVAAGAELLSVYRDGHALELTFYTPARATILLRLEEQPRRVVLDEIRPEAEWNRAQRRLAIEIMRGAAPDFLRVVKVHLPYTPHVPEKPDPGKSARRDYDYAVFDAVRLPLGDDASLPTHPPLILLNASREGQMLVQTRNYGALGRDVDVRVEGAVRGSASVGLGADEIRHAQVNLRPAGSANSAADGNSENVLRGELQVRSGNDRRSSPLAFVVVPEEGTTTYQYDFDRDGANEWVLENSELRLIVSPEAGGRAVGIVDKLSGTNLTTPVGAFRDHFAFTPNPEDTRPGRARGAYGTFNRPYQAAWAHEGPSTALRLTYDAPDVFPAGARIEKLVRFVGSDRIEFEYAVTLNGERSRTLSAVAESQAAGGQPQAFVAAHSLPVVARGDRGTRFCWKAESGEERHCESFVPGRGAVELPEGVKRLEVETLGRFALAYNWETARVTLEMKRFSTMLKLLFPPLVPGGEPGKYRVQMEVLPAP